jgi:sigma-B regulation protein RsbU (phosphoserine phosphatase)
MELLNAELCESSVRGMFVTMVAGLLHPTTGQVDLVNAGHPPALWMQASGEIIELPAAAPPLGVLPEANYQTASLLLDSGMLFMFSDGLSECRPEGAEALGIEGVKRVLTGLRHTPPERRLEQIVDLVSTADRPPRDDLTLLLIGR